jgi:hypothetical protein
MTSHLSDIYPIASVRGRRITRLPEKYLDWTVLDATSAEDLGRESVGWFVGNHPGPASAVEQLGRLDANPDGGVWVVVPVSRHLSCELFENWPHLDRVIGRPTENNSVWRSRKVWVAVPEDLKQLLPFARTLTIDVAGVIVVDPHCLMYRARAGTNQWGAYHRNDRPQHVVNFRAAFDADGWQPPFLLLTTKPAKSVNTEVVARAFCLNGFRFIAGDMFNCGEIATEE